MGCRKDNFSRWLLCFLLQETFDFPVSLRNGLKKNQSIPQIYRFAQLFSAYMKLLRFSEVKCFVLSNRNFDITRGNEGNHANVKLQ